MQIPLKPRHLCGWGQICLPGCGIERRRDSRRAGLWADDDVGIEHFSRRFSPAWNAASWKCNCDAPQFPPSQWKSKANQWRGDIQIAQTVGIEIDTARSSLTINSVGNSGSGRANVNVGGVTITSTCDRFPYSFADPNRFLGGRSATFTAVAKGN
jgi:hypothetical protein